MNRQHKLRYEYGSKGQALVGQLPRRSAPFRAVVLNLFSIYYTLFGNWGLFIYLHPHSAAPNIFSGAGKVSRLTDVTNSRNRVILPKSWKYLRKAQWWCGRKKPRKRPFYGGKATMFWLYILANERRCCIISTERSLARPPQTSVLEYLIFKGRVSVVWVQGCSWVTGKALGPFPY